MKVVRAELFEKNLPLKEPFEHATSGRISALEEIYVKLETDEGFAGYGEVRGNCMYFTGDCTKSVEAVLQEILLPSVLGQNPLNLSEAWDRMDSVIVGNTAAKAAVDCAFYDLAGKIKGVPVYELLGGCRRNRLKTEENIPFCPLDETARRAEKIIKNGCRFIKIRVGLKPFQRDLERVRAVWDVMRRLGTEDVELAIDANQSWTPKEAVDRIDRLYEYGVRIVEQPVPARNMLGMKYVRKHVKARIFADESVFTPEDLANAIALQAIDGVHIKLIKAGGITGAMKMCTLAETNHLAYMIGGMDEGMMAVAAAVQCAAAANADYHELDGHRRIEKDVSAGLTVEHAEVIVPDLPGLGVQIDDSQLIKVGEYCL